MESSSSARVTKYERFCKLALANGKKFEVLPNHIKVSSALENISVHLELSQYGIQSIVSSPDLLLQSCKELERRLREKHPEISRIGFHSWKNQINFFIAKSLDTVQCKLQVTCPMQSKLIWKDVEVSIDARPAIKEEIKTTVIDLEEHTKTKKDTPFWYITKLKARIKDQPFQTSTLLWRFLLTDLETKEEHAPLIFIQMNGGESYASKLQSFFDQWELYCQREVALELPTCLLQLLETKKGKHGMEDEKPTKVSKHSISKPSNSNASSDWNALHSENLLPSLLQLRQQLNNPVNNVNTSTSIPIANDSSSSNESNSSSSATGSANNIQHTEEVASSFTMSISIAKVLQCMQYLNETNSKMKQVQE